MLLLSVLLPTTRRKAGGGLAAAPAVKGTGRTCRLLPVNESNRVGSRPGFSQDVPASRAAVSLAVPPKGCPNPRLRAFPPGGCGGSFALPAPPIPSSLSVVTPSSLRHQIPLLLLLLLLPRCPESSDPAC